MIRMMLCLELFDIQHPTCSVNVTAPSLFQTVRESSLGAAAAHCFFFFFYKQIFKQLMEWKGMDWSE